MILIPYQNCRYITSPLTPPMTSNSNARPAGIEIIVQTFKELNGLISIQADAPVRDDYEPDFWYPGSVWAEIEDSEEGRRVAGFASEIQGQWNWPIDGLRCMEIVSQRIEGTTQLTMRIYLFDPDDVNEIFAWCSRFLLEGWTGYLKTQN